MRGKDAIQRHPSCGFGITPACAGKRRTDSKTTLSHEDHPRVCGEKTPFSENSFTKSGSPPRVRGKACAICTFPLSQRITPACAGKRSARSAACLAGKDHPRVCGEKLHSLSPQLCVHGSPPRVRGKVDAATLTLKARGITPACAGKRLLPCCFWRLHRDHPRVCGEKVRPWSSRGLDRGSPPRVRGKADADAAPRIAAGITPACAGKRSLRQ